MKRKRNTQRNNQKAGRSGHTRVLELKRAIRSLSRKKKILDEHLQKLVGNVVDASRGSTTNAGVQAGSAYQVPEASDE